MRFPYLAIDNQSTSLMPRLPMTLVLGTRSMEVTGLLDSGSAINVLPYQIGLTLGAVWKEQTTLVQLVGSLGQFEARALALQALHPKITSDTPARLVFAWTRAEDAPLILGQMNFFFEFNVCFYRQQGFFEIERNRNG